MMNETLTLTVALFVFGMIILAHIKGQKIYNLFAFAGTITLLLEFIQQPVLAVGLTGLSLWLLIDTFLIGGSEE